MLSLEKIESNIERKNSEIETTLAKISELKAKLKQYNEELIELQNQRIICIVTMSNVDVRTLKDKLLSITATGEIGASAPIANTIITERNTEDEENEEDE